VRLLSQVRNLLIPDLRYVGPDAWTVYQGLRKTSLSKVWRRSSTDLSVAMVYAEELDLETQQKAVLSDVVIYQDAPRQTCSARFSRPVGQPRAAPRAAAYSLHGVGGVRMNETEKKEIVI
jgi:hypothetical protein